jgi:hypothetical protein
MSSNAEFPSPVYQNGRMFFVDRDAEDYLRALAGRTPLPCDPAEPLKLRSAQQFADDLGVGRRTIGRRVAQRNNATGDAA